MPAACFVALCCLVTRVTAHDSTQISGHMMCDRAVLDSQKLGFSSHSTCYDHRQIDAYFYRQSLWYHPDKHTKDSSNAAFHCLETARQRLKMKSCQHGSPPTPSVALVYHDFHVISFYVAFAMIMLAADVNEVIMLGFLWMLDLSKLPQVFFMWRAAGLLLDLFSVMRRGKDLDAYEGIFE